MPQGPGTAGRVVFPLLPLMIYGLLNAGIRRPRNLFAMTKIPSSMIERLKPIPPAAIDRVRHP